MNKFIHIGFVFAGIPKILDLEPTFNSMGDQWVRYSPTTWIMWTEKDAPTIFGWLSGSIDVQDNVLIAPLDIQACFGRMPPWVWEWLRQCQASITTSTTLHGRGFLTSWQGTS